MENILEIHKLRKEYEEFVLDSIDWKIPRGYITGLIGPNGAGKTTTIKLVLNLIKKDNGTVRVFGTDHIDNEVEIKNRIGYVGEEQPFYENKSAVWTGKFVSHFFDNWDMEGYLSLLENFQIPAKKNIRKYSKGMRVKLAMAMALSHHADLIILDEPTAGLDPVIRREILEHLRDLADDTGITVLISSHITDDIERTADFVTYLIKGRIALTASKDDLQSNWKKIHFSKDTLGRTLVDSLEKVEDHMFGCSGITREYLSLKDKLDSGIAGGDIKVETLGLDDILIFLAQEK